MKSHHNFRITDGDVVRADFKIEKNKPIAIILYPTHYAFPSQKGRGYIKMGVRPQPPGEYTVKGILRLSDDPDGKEWKFNVDTYPLPGYDLYEIHGLDASMVDYSTGNTTHYLLDFEKRNGQKYKVEAR